MQPVIGRWKKNLRIIHDSRNDSKRQKQDRPQLAIHIADPDDENMAESVPSRDTSSLGGECTQLMPLFEDALRFWDLYHLIDEYRKTGLLRTNEERPEFSPLPSQISGKMRIFLALFSPRVLPNGVMLIICNRRKNSLGF